MAAKPPSTAKATASARRRRRFCARRFGSWSSNCRVGGVFGTHPDKLQTRPTGGFRRLHPPYKPAWEGSMPEYRRRRIPGGSYFFTAVAASRRPILATDLGRQCLHEAIAAVK